MQISCVRGIKGRGVVISCGWEGEFLEAQCRAEPSRKSSGQASGQSIDCPRTNAWPCFALYFASRYTSSFVGRASAERRECNDIRRGLYGRSSFPLHWHSRNSRAMQHGATEMHCISRYILVTDCMYIHTRRTEFLYLACPRESIKYSSSSSFFLYILSPSLLLRFFSRFTKPKIDINNAIMTCRFEGIFDISRFNAPRDADFRLFV